MHQPDLSTTRAKDLALALLAMTQFVIIIDASIVNVALPSIGKDLHFSQDDLSWVVNAYVLTFGGFLLLGGRLADHLGRRRMFIWGFGVFSLASLAGGLATSSVMLVIARAVQGLGGAIISPAALSILTTTFAEGKERNRALATWGAVAGAGGAAGTLMGGMLTEWVGWQAVLFVNVPIGVFGMLMAPRLLPESRIVGERRTFDIPGAVAVTAGLSLLVFAIVDTATQGWGSVDTLDRIAGAAGLLLAFIGIELRTHKPLMPFAIFRLRTLRGSNIVALLSSGAMFSMFFFITLYLQQVLGYSALKTGLIYLPMSLVIIVAAASTSPLMGRIGFKNTLILGLIFDAAGLFWFSRIGADGTWYGQMLGPSLLCAIGVGLPFVAVTVGAVTGTAPHQAGLASGLINTSQQIGAAVGVAVLASIANATTGDAMRDSAPRVALNEGFRDAFLTGAIIATIAAVLAMLLISSRDSRAYAEALRRGEAGPVAA